MITGAHVTIYSKDADADRAFFRKIVGLPHVDAGGGWLIFALPPTEVALHPSDENDLHHLYLICDDVKAVMNSLKAKNITCAPLQQANWGAVTSITLPGGGKVGLYQPKHKRPVYKAQKKAKRRSAKRR